MQLSHDWAYNNNGRHLRVYKIPSPYQHWPDYECETLISLSVEFMFSFHSHYLFPLPIVTARSEKNIIKKLKNWFGVDFQMIEFLSLTVMV